MREHLDQNVTATHLAEFEGDGGSDIEQVADVDDLPLQSRAFGFV